MDVCSTVILGNNEDLLDRILWQNPCRLVGIQEMAGVSGILKNSAALRSLCRNTRVFSSSICNQKNEQNGGTWLPLNKEDATIAVHAGYDPKEHPNGPLILPISLATTFEQESPGQFKVQVNAMMRLLTRRQGLCYCSQ